MYQASGAPVLLRQENSNRAIAFDSVTLLAEPFQPQAAVKFSDDGRTRIMLFTTNLILLPGEDASSVTAQAEDGTHRFYNLPVEAVLDLPGFNSFQTVIVKVSDDLSSVGDVLVGIKWHAQSSNRVRIGIGYVGGGPPDDNPTPTPTPAAPLGISTSVATVVPGAAISGSLTGNTSAVDPTYDWIGLYEVNADNAKYLSWTRPSLSSGSVFTANFVAPTNPGEYEFRYLPMNGYADIARASFTVIVATPTPTPTPQSTPTPVPTPLPTPTPAQDPFGIRTSVATVVPGAAISVSPTGNTSAVNATDWIGLYGVNADNANYLSWTRPSLSAGSLFTAVFVAPTNPGQYEFRYFPNNSYADIARASFAVIAATPTPTPTPQPTPTPTPQPTPTPLAPILVAQPSSVATGGGISVSLTGIWAPTGDWVGLYRVGAPDAQFLDFRFAAASMTFTAPATAGNYNFRYLARNESGIYYVVATSNTVTVASSQPTPTPTPSATPTPTPTATPTPTPTPTPSPTPLPAGQCTWYVATNGSSNNNGSANSPWALSTVWGGNPNFGGTPPPTAIQPGDTICLRGGTYLGGYRTYLLGTPSAQITVQPYPGERVTIDGGGITIDGGGYLTIRDMELTNSNPSRTDYRAGGFNVATVGIKLINNIIHDGGAGIVSNVSGYNDEFYGNVIYNVGWDDRTTGLMQGGTGPGVYAENGQGFKKFYSNIIATSFGYGFHIYTAGSSALAGFDVQNNVSYNNGYWTRVGDSPYATEGRTTTNYLFGSSNVPITNLTFINNFGYHREQRGGMNLELGYGGGENAGATALSNTFIGGANSVAKFASINFTGNIITSNFGALDRTPPASVVSETINNNTYYFYPSSCANPKPFSNDGGNTALSVAQWMALGYDANSTFRPCGIRPSVSVTLDPNAYDTKRANLIVSNLAGNSTVSVNLSSFLNNGDSFEIHDAQNYYGPLVASGTYNGPVTINMNGLTVATPVGYNSTLMPLAQMTSGPQFGAFILIKK